ncbi:hypothetical protein IC582_009431 [Cucumis melo]|uniref:Uncharacterized protein LOC103486480 n=2 Tax=Cucumis melo TaxID=3656 RepID=A0A1S3B5S2_CUCME|nr:uncharacterized protein LOC103486480 [Cucumis melo]KAA0044011.1 Senescence regulator [Cucumis melo var. makuwa]TYK25129.1 Senescence regulator [Cucumis melo var. makuwa]
MASRRGGLGFGFGFHSKPNYIYPASESLRYSESSTENGLFEFDESDIWTSATTTTPTPPMESRKIFPISKKLPKRSGSAATAVEKAVKASSSLPVNIPDWSKILQKDQNKHGRRAVAEEDFDDSDDEDDDIRRAPPHEYLARRRGDSFSVHEGIGRTLKGRDLRMVRNAIWKKTGFED